MSTSAPPWAPMGEKYPAPNLTWLTTHRPAWAMPMVTAVRTLCPGYRLAWDDTAWRPGRVALPAHAGQDNAAQCVFRSLPDGFYGGKPGRTGAAVASETARSAPFCRLMIWPAPQLPDALFTATQVFSSTGRAPGPASGRRYMRTRTQRRNARLSAAFLHRRHGLLHNQQGSALTTPDAQRLQNPGS
jgi:hypothetical protein